MDGHVQHDGFGRDINYLRIAVTDKCNFRCIYCMPADGVAPRAHDELLSAEEIARFVRLVAGEGIRRVRLTGGESLVSRRIIPLIRDIRAIPQIEDISLTTNGALLPKLAPQLKDAGLNRVNISLDTLDPAQFRQITRRGELQHARRHRCGACGRVQPREDQRGGRAQPRPGLPRVREAVHR
ncbi:MAG: radical SAM protein, partial [Collinsella sp.]